MENDSLTVHKNNTYAHHSLLMSVYRVRAVLNPAPADLLITTTKEHPMHETFWITSLHLNNLGHFEYCIINFSIYHKDLRFLVVFFYVLTVIVSLSFLYNPNECPIPPFLSISILAHSTLSKK